MSSLAEAYQYLDSLAAVAMQELGLPGMALAVTSRDRLLKTSAYGLADIAAQSPVTTSTLFEIGSLGKPFTVIPLLQLREAGVLDLNAPISNYLPWFRIQSDFPEITIHHLLNHTSGLPRGTDIAPHGLYERWSLGSFRPVAAPGEYFCYSNLGYKTLGFLLEHITGQLLPEIIQHRVFQPLGMSQSHASITVSTRAETATGYTSIYDDRPEHHRHPMVPAIWAPYATGDGSQASTVGDMSAYLRMLLNSGRGPTGKLLSEQSIDLMTENGVWTGDDYYGYGLATYSVEGRRYTGHGGGNAGFRSAMVLDMEAGIGVILLANRMGETDPLVEVAQRALTAVCASTEGKELPPIPGPTDSARLQNAADYAGAYHSSSESLDFVAEGGRLLLKYAGQSIPLEKRPHNSFYAPHPDFSLALFEFSPEGEKAVEAFHGGDWYVRDSYSGPRHFEYPDHWNSFTGHYRARNPELSNFRIVLRKGVLTFLNPWGNAEPLAPLTDNTFRIGSCALSPEILEFSAIADGRALRADYTGCPYYRASDP